MKILSITVKYHFTDEQLQHESIKEMISGLESGEFAAEISLPQSNEDDFDIPTAVKTEVSHTLETIEENAG